MGAGASSFTVGKASTERRGKMGQALQLHAQLDVLMANCAEFMCYSIMELCGDEPLWTFSSHGIPFFPSSPSVSLCLSASLCSLP